MQPDLVEWACNLETHVCQMLDRHVLNALICIGLAFLAMGIGALVDMIIEERRW